LGNPIIVAILQKILQNAFLQDTPTEEVEMQQGLWTASLALIVGCGMNEDKFEEKYAEAYCGWLEDCAKLSDMHGTMDVCLKAEKIYADETLTPDECEYDKKVAKECIKEIQDNDDCDIDDSVPDECATVSTCTSADTGE